MSTNPQPPRPGPTGGLRHVALNVEDMEACERFYVDLLGMEVEWRPDADNVYLTSGNDNLALHRAVEPAKEGQRLDHIGFIINEIDEVDDWYLFLKGQGIDAAASPRTHRDGARSFYIKDPDDNLVQLIYHPPISRCPQAG